MLPIYHSSSTRQYSNNQERAGQSRTNQQPRSRSCPSKRRTRSCRGRKIISLVLGSGTGLGSWRCLETTGVTGRRVGGAIVAAWPSMRAAWPSKRAASQPSSPASADRARRSSRPSCGKARGSRCWLGRRTGKLKTSRRRAWPCRAVVDAVRQASG